MPIQINEVIIRAIVDSGAVTAGASGTSTTTVTTDTETALVDKLLEIIKEKKER